MATVSLCMIVKNEEAVLGRCLASVRDGVDEIIVVDTGSTDATKAIAAQYGAQVYHFPWVDDFAAARNFSFSKATQDWILWLDADDVLLPEDLAAFCRLKDNIPDHIGMVMMRYHTAFDEEGRPTFSFYRGRLVRRSIPHTWEGRVHEAIIHTSPTLYVDIAVTHRSVKTSYPDRNLKIYEKQLAEEGSLNPRDQFYYGRELYYHRRYEQAKTVLQAFLDEGQGWVENNIEACKILSYCYTQTQAPQQAVDALTRSFRYDAPRAEICCELGNLFLQQEQYLIAIFWYELALTRPKNEAGGGFVSQDCYGYLPCIQLCVCYDRLGQREKAEAYNQRAGSYRPSSPAYLHNLDYFKRTAPHPPEAS